jgi:uncharacterized protein
MIGSEGQLTGRRLQPDEEFHFHCRPDLACFNSCCRDKRLTLFPYDVLRLKRALGISSEIFLAERAELELDPESGWPLLRIRLAEEGRCPFVTESGCAVYAERPTCCRIFPLARAVAAGADGATLREVFLASEAPSCLGWREPEAQTITIRSWIEEQGLEDYQQANNTFQRILLHPNRPRTTLLSPRQVHAVILAQYNLDVFCETASKPGFAERFGLSENDVAEDLGSDEALLRLGTRWLEGQLSRPTP